MKRKPSKRQKQKSIDRLDSELTLADRRAAPYHPNQQAWAALAEALAQGGGPRALERQHGKGRLSARERIALLLDDGAPFDELMRFAGWEPYPEAGGAPAGGVVTGIGPVAGRDWMIVANDATVKAGAFFPITAKKVIRAQTIVFENRLPTIYLVDSAGVYLPMQDEIFPDQDDFGRVFYLNARMSAGGIPQIAAIMGNCVAGGAYLPVMYDTLIMTEGVGAVPGRPGAGQGRHRLSSEELGAAMHAQVAGTVDYHEPDDASALQRVRNLAATYAPANPAPWARDRRQPEAPAEQETDLEGLLPPEGGSQPYDMREIITRLVDGSRFDEFKADYGQTLICGSARLGGYPIGIVANQKLVIESRGRLEIGGVIYADAADKAARFILNCNQAAMPILFLHDVSGFMVGKESEQQGIIRRGAKMVKTPSPTAWYRASA